VLWTLGQYDLVVLAEAPNNEPMVPLVLCRSSRNLYKTGFSTSLDDDIVAQNTGIMLAMIGNKNRHSSSALLSHFTTSVTDEPA